MYRQVCLFLALLLALSAGMVRATLDLRAQQDQVTFTETRAYVRTEAPEGISVSMALNYDSYLYWDTLCRMGGEPAGESTFRFEQTGRGSSTRVRYDTGWSGAYLESNYSMTSSGSDLTEDENRSMMLRCAIDVASRTAPGETRKETVRVTDYYDYYYLQYHLFSRRMEYLVDDRSQEQLNDYFRIPVLPEHTLTITLTKNGEGKVVELESRTNLELQIDLYAASDKESVYFTFAPSFIVIDPDSEAWQQRRQPVDLSHVKGGAGIYRVTQDNETGSLKIDNVFPFPDDGIEASHLSISAGLDKLLLFTKRENDLLMQAIDKSGTVLQELTFDTPERIVSGVYVNECGVLAVFDNARFSFLTEQPDGYHERIVSSLLIQAEDGEPFDLTDNFSSFSSVGDFDWDGRRLAVAAAKSVMMHGDSETMYTLAVYDETGPLYCGDYTNSVLTGAQLQKTYNLLALTAPLDVRFD